LSHPAERCPAAFLPRPVPVPYTPATPRWRRRRRRG
jgi:hypothetical protein